MMTNATIAPIIIVSYFLFLFLFRILLFSSSSPRFSSKVPNAKERTTMAAVAEIKKDVGVYEYSHAIAAHISLEGSFLFLPSNYPSETRQKHRNTSLREPSYVSVPCPDCAYVESNIAYLSVI